MSTTHALFYISTSCLESENEVLKDYLLRLPIQRQVQVIILGHSESTSTFFYHKSIDLCISGKLNNEIINLSCWRKIQVTTKNFAIGTTCKLRDAIRIPL